MNLEPLKEKLGDETFTQLKAHVEELAGQRDAARAESIDGRKKLKAEVEQLRGIKTTLFEKLGLDDDADLDTLPEAKGQAEALKQFELKLKRLEREKAEAIAKAGEVESKYQSSRLDAALRKAIAAHDFVDSDTAEKLIRSDVQWEDDRIMVRHGDKLIPMEDGVKLLAQTKSFLMKAQGRAGSGHQANAGSAGQSSMTRAAFEALSPQARVDAAKAGVELT